MPKRIAVAVRRRDGASECASARSVFALVGNTPLLDLSTYSPHRRVKIFAKAEWQNPGRSVKDRAASRMIQVARRRGQLTCEKILLDSTSGNTGVAYALFGAALHLRVRLVVPENVSRHQKNLLAAYGAEVIWTSASEGSDGALRVARALQAEAPSRYFYINQYDNPENWRAHFHTTAPELWQQTHGRLTHFIAGLGTSGTFVGTGRCLRQFNPAIRLIALQPDSPLHGLEGLKHMPTAIVPAIYDPHLADDHLAIATEEAQELVRDVARRHGWLIGLSSGAALAAARRVAGGITHGVIATIFPDGGHRYLEESFWHEA
ncbi:MAG: cysteine synthase family protein [candidate division KSB1 bacterium]|nr:cysteine synthase family protein [candidate division KSB1 bacterium]MDZ7274834.1 cysteine synthase family protein [candidate division KSB1 bacterium]MDZ7288201.1 cysteine synthase family protein [candidate division KSB1 bacterium]MDZ7300418.1 cysteine synthase family protein [candidate division KSB1 bacterium]MDZ7308127.1 cysteine synthase family protein [candidate division KSB1 bacterium]